MNRIFLCLCVLILVLAPLSAAAQRCEVDAEAILNLKRADIGSFAVWDSVHGDEDDEDQYVEAILQNSGHIAVAGTRQSLGQPFPTLILAEIDRRGRVAWETKRVVKGLDKILALRDVGGDMAVLARIKDGRDRASLWLGFFNEKGAFRAAQDFRYPKGDFVNGDIIPATQGKGFVMVASGVSDNPAVTRSSLFYRLNSKAQVISKRAFNPGPDNGLYNIMPTAEGYYLASGYIKNARGRKTGWLLKVDGNGNIQWQRQYPRGISAELVKASDMPDGSIFAIGNALPALENALKAGWAVQLDPTNGAIMWQRYFTQDADYTAKDSLISKDGLISILLDAKPVEGGFAEEGELPKDYVRLVTLNPRGVIFESKAFFQGEVADAHNMLLGPSGERIIVGTTRIAYQQVNEEGEEMVKDEMDKPTIKRSLEGWVVAAPRVDDYFDPCKPKEERELKEL